MDNIDFTSGSMLEGVDRRNLLQQAAQELDARRSHLGPSHSEVPKTAEGDLVREMMEDAASFEGFPRVYKITEKGEKYREQGFRGIDNLLKNSSISSSVSYH